MDAIKINRDRSFAYFVASVAMMIAAAPLVLAAFVFTDWFLIERLHFCDGCGGVRRHCAGIESQWGNDELRHLYEGRCVGIPYGEWDCLELNSEGRFVPTECR
jgi:hypothetical protein